MVFKALFLAHTPDAEPKKHRSVIETSKYKLFVTLVRNQEQALEVSKEFVEKQGVCSILLCPGFTNKDVAELSEAVGENVSVSVARGDGPSNRIAIEALKRAGWFSKE